MRFAIDVPNFGPYANPATFAALARETEDAGWDGFFSWDHINVNWPDPVGDPWILLAAAALATTRIRLGPLVTPIPRRHPWKLARETVTLDHLSNGRVVLGVGSAEDVFKELSTFGTPTDPKTKAAMLDEGLEIVTGLWSAKPFQFDGKHYQVKETTFLPAPIQTPRIPIWVAATWPNKPPLRRAARFDGVVPILGELAALTPAVLREIVGYIRRHRTSAQPFDVACSGETPGDDVREDAAMVAPFADAGATWWLEGRLPWKATIEQLRDRIRKGPPR